MAFDLATCGTAVVDIANTEQRVVNPDLRTTAVARRDVRAVPGAETAFTMCAGLLATYSCNMASTYTRGDKWRCPV